MPFYIAGLESAFDASRSLKAFSSPITFQRLQARRRIAPVATSCLLSLLESAFDKLNG